MTTDPELTDQQAQPLVGPTRPTPQPKPALPICANCHQPALTGGWLPYPNARRWGCTVCTGEKKPHPLFTTPNPQPKLF